jgi:hypothetical protein
VEGAHPERVGRFDSDDVVLVDVLGTAHQRERRAHLLLDP